VTSRASIAGVERLLIDGNNLLHRVSGGPDAGALRLLLARLKTAIPAPTTAIVMLDGHPAPGTQRRQRVRRGLEIHHSGSLSADDALLNLIRDAAPQTRAATTLVSDDRALTDRARHLGARTQRLTWLEELLASAARGSVGIGGGSVGIGGGRRPQPGSDVEDDREPWKPGRGATKKRGNPRRGCR
jgi:hypothetical protein